MKDLFLTPLFGNGMVMQRNVPFPVWSRKKVSVTICGKTYEAQPKDGKWLVTLDPVPAGGPFSIQIESGNEKISLQDIYAGDVWLAAGQSNMEMQMERLRDDFPEEWTPDIFPPIRQFKVTQEWDFSGPREELSGSWTAASRETLQGFSGTAWFFAKNLYEKYRVPIGIVNTAWGGTPVEAWMSREALAGFPEKIAAGDQYADPAFCKKIAAESGAAIQEWESRLIREDQGLAEKWQEPQTSISHWGGMTLPGDFLVSGLANFCGAVWLAREFDAPAGLAAGDANVWLGTITDSDTVYINGIEIGNTGYRYPPRKYLIPAGVLKPGKNRIVIRVICNNGEGCVTMGKPFRIFSGKGCVELAGTWKYQTGAHALVRPAEFFFQRQPMGAWNAMIAPVMNYPFKGVIWYQGESNDPNPGEYAALFRSMIQDWRKKNGNNELPFLFVQLPVFGSPSENNEAASWAIIREAQKEALSLPCTGMAAALDLGEWNDLHPLNKKDVGHRLFLAAENVANNAGAAATGPMLRSIERQGEKIYLTFDNAGGGLCARETVHVSAATGKAIMRLPAKIEGPDTLSIEISAVQKCEKVLYAWANNPKDRQLYNSEGLPAIPFKVELPC